MKKLITKIAIICSSLMMIVSCATLQEVRVDLNNEDQNLNIISTETKFAQLDAKLIPENLNRMFKYTGESTDNYVTGKLYCVEEVV